MRVARLSAKGKEPLVLLLDYVTILFSNFLAKISDKSSDLNRRSMSPRKKITGEVSNSQVPSNVINEAKSQEEDDVSKVKTI